MFLRTELPIPEIMFSYESAQKLFKVLRPPTFRP